MKDLLERRNKQLELMKEERDLLLHWLGNILDLVDCVGFDNANHGNMERLYKLGKNEEIREKGWEIYNEIARFKS